MSFADAFLPLVRTRDIHREKKLSELKHVIALDASTMALE